MNKSVTSRERLLSAAKELAQRQGLAAVNIRAVASACGVAVGSIYNYFPTKADLTAALIEDFWRSAVDMEACVCAPGESFPAYVGRLYQMLARNLADFQSDWLTQITALGSEERDKGRELEAKCFNHIKRGLRFALDQNKAGGPLLLDEADREEFTKLVFSTLMSLLRRGADSCAYFQRVLEALF